MKLGHAKEGGHTDSAENPSWKVVIFKPMKKMGRY
jgi:hypothetical protein